MEYFRNNRLDIGDDLRPYGAHSFRRGGRQYLAMVLRSPFRNICSWYGWAENFDNPGTLFKYYLSLNAKIILIPIVQQEIYAPHVTVVAIALESIFVMLSLI